jgi:hypothetical protein
MSPRHGQRLHDADVAAALFAATNCSALPSRGQESFTRRERTLEVADAWQFSSLYTQNSGEFAVYFI